MTCTACHRDTKIVARGLCRACYSRWQKRGTTEYAEKRSRNFCPIDNCGKAVVSGGLCDMHRKRLARRGHIDETRPDSWGAKGGHPLYNAWSHLRRYRATHPVAESWVDDFLQFVADVGVRPSPKHKLFSADPSEPIGPTNFVWKRSITERVEGETAKAYAARTQKVYRALRQEAYRGYELKKRFGISEPDRAVMIVQQGGGCAICGAEERNVIHGRRISLAVDHCHTQGHVRALLCTGCNTGLGCFRDAPSLLRAAAEYIERHTLPEPTE
jgi:hypothetical protein